MALQNNNGTMPQGEQVPLPVAGIAASTNEPLAANEVWRSGIVKYSGLDAVQAAISSDVPGIYNVEYYLGDTKLNFMGNTTVFDPAIVAAFQLGLTAKGDGFQLVYRNGPSDQTTFFCEIRYSDGIQETLRSIGVPMSATNLASTTHAAIEGRENGAGPYYQVTVTPLNDKRALDVNVINPSGNVDTSNLAKEDSLQDLINKIIAAPSTEAKQDAAIAILNSLLSSLNGGVSINTLPAGSAQDSSLQQIVSALAGTLKVDLQDTDYAKDSSVQSTILLLTAIRDRISTNPATETTLNSILSKLNAGLTVNTISGYSTSALQQTIIDRLNGTLTVAPITGASTASLQTTGNSVLSSIDGKTPTLGTKTAANSSPVVLASDQSAIPVTQTNPTDVSGLATQATLSNLNDKVPTKGQKVSSGSVPVVISSDQSNVPVTVSNPVTSVAISNFPATQPVSLASAPLPAGASTSALQQTIIDRLTTNVTNGSTAALQTALNTAIGTQADPAVTDSTASASLISLIKGLLTESIAPATAGSVQTIALAAGVAQTLPANVNAKGRLIFSVSGTILINLGQTATATAYGMRIITNSAYEVPDKNVALSVSLFSATAATVNVLTTT